MPNLRRLYAIGDYNTSVTVLAGQWKESFLKHTPHLVDFRFYLNISSKDESSNIDELLKPFREEFWQERKWYAMQYIQKKEKMYIYIHYHFHVLIEY